MQGFDGPDAITAGVGMGRNVLCGGAMGILASWHLGILASWHARLLDQTDKRGAQCHIGTWTKSL